jgi:hypothetical protein
MKTPPNTSISSRQKEISAKASGLQFIVNISRRAVIAITDDDGSSFG